MKPARKTTSQVIGTALNSPHGTYVWNRLNLVMIVLFVGFMAWMGGAQWERAHYAEQRNWLNEECVRRMDRADPEKLNPP